MNTTPQQAAIILKMLGMRYAPRHMPWNNPNENPETSRQIAEMFHNTLTRYDHEAVLAATERLCHEHPDWTPNLNQYLQIIQEEARRVRAEQTRNRALTERTTCEGSGLIETTTGYRPCATCNPFMYSEWENGNWNDNGPEREKRRKTWYDRHGAMPQPCHNHATRYDNNEPIPPTEGIELAKIAYLEEIERLNKDNPLYDKNGKPQPRQPDITKFNKFITAAFTEF